MEPSPSLVVDVHTHVVPAHIPDGGTRKAWPGIKHAENGEASVMIDGRVFRRIDSRCWDVARRLDDMRADGVDFDYLRRHVAGGGAERRQQLHA